MHISQATNRMLGVTAVAEITGYHPQTVRRWFRDRQVPGAFKINGRDFRISEADLANYIASLKGNATA